MNISAIINEEGALCFVHDAPLPDAASYLFYSEKRNRLSLTLENGSIIDFGTAPDKACRLALATAATILLAESNGGAIIGGSEIPLKR